MPGAVHHAYGFGLAALAAPLAGATTVVTSADRPGMLSRAVHGQGVTLRRPGVTPLLRLLAEATTSRPEGRIGYLSAGMPMDSRTAELVGTKLGGWLGEVYGTTETGPICVRAPVPWQDAQSLGEPLEGVQVDLRPLEPGHDAADSLSGLVAVRSLTAMTGYLYPDRVDPEPVANGFVTGDIGRMTPDGLVIVGRAGQLRQRRRHEGEPGKRSRPCCSSSRPCAPAWSTVNRTNGVASRSGPR